LKNEILIIFNWTLNKMHKKRDFNNPFSILNLEHQFFCHFWRAKVTKTLLIFCRRFSLSRLRCSERETVACLSSFLHANYTKRIA
jgi:hypothetical protein